MTRVRISGYFLAYQVEMPQIVREIVKYKYIAGVQTYPCENPLLNEENFLPPPRIEMIDLIIYEGHVDDLIMIATSDDFGIANIHMTIKDEQGNLIESGDASPWLDRSGLWDYITIASIPAGTTVIVSAAATDMVGGVGKSSKRITIDQDIEDPMRGDYL